MSDGNSRFEELGKNDDVSIKTIVGDALVLVEFWATWCWPCRMAKPVADAVSMKPENADVRFVRIEIDEMPEASSSMGNRSIPTYMMWSLGEKVGENVVGYQTEDALMEMIAKARSWRRLRSSTKK